MGSHWSNWQDLGSPSVPYKTFKGDPSVEKNPNGLVQIFARGQDGKIYTTEQTAPTATSFKAWAELDLGAATMDCNSDLTVEALNSGLLAVFCQHADGSVLGAYHLSSGSFESFTPWTKWPVSVGSASKAA